MRRLIAIIVTLLILAYLGAVMKKLWVDEGLLWTMPIVFLAILAAGYWISEPHERQEFKDVGRSLLRRLGL